MSLFADYFKEKDGKDTIETDDGFMVYRINGQECYIEHVFVKKEKRQSSVARQMLEQVERIAKESGCKFVSGSVRPSALGSTSSLKALLAVGFVLHSSHQDAVLFIKELKNG